MGASFDDGDVRIYHGDALEVLRGLPDESVQCIVTSPPFWALRDYGVDGQIGLEPTPDAWCDALVAVFRECRRVLRNDGVCFVEVGDTYNANQGNGFNVEGYAKEESKKARVGGKQPQPPGVKPKDLVGAPWLLAFALRNDGWYLRSDIIWARPNPMPESVTDRPTKAHSYVFLLTKSARYFYDADAIREESTADPLWNQRAMEGRWQRQSQGKTDASRSDAAFRGKGANVSAGVTGFRNARSVWSIPTEPTPFAHFATFPQALVERCIKAGTSEHGACAACGAPWVRIVEREKISSPRRSTSFSDAHGRDGRDDERASLNVTTTGWEPTCSHSGSEFRSAERGSPSNGHSDGRSKPTSAMPPCSASGYGSTEDGSSVQPCVVLDPFMGSGTTALVARRLGRHAIGIELNAEYIAIARERLAQLSLFAPEVSNGR